MNLKKTILTLSKVILSISILFFIYLSIDIKSTFEILQRINFKFYFLALVILFFQTLIASFRWRNILRIFGFKYGFLKMLHYLWVGIFCNQILPSSIGGDAVRGYYLYKNGNNLKDTTLSILIDRLSGIIGLVVLFFLTIPFLFNKLESFIAQLGVLLVSISVFIIISAFFSFDMLPKKWASLSIFRGLYSLSSKSRKVLLSKYPGLRLFLMSVMVHFLSIVAVIILSESLKLNINWLSLFLVVPLTAMFMILPISIAGWGVREGVMVIGLGYLGVVPEKALALSILYGLLMLLFALPGGIFWFIDVFFKKMSS